jgi:hypothetical protein
VISVLFVLLLAACGSDSSTTTADPTASSPAVATEPNQGAADCSEEEVGSSEETPFTVVHYVDDGALGAVCLGSEDPVLRDAWDALATIASPAELALLGWFGGFTDPESGDSDESTYAFVTPPTTGDTFQMAVNLPAFEADPDEALLTIAHEFSHVFSSVPSELDRSDQAWATCTTYLSANGCFVPGSLIAEWVDRFWSPWVDEIDPDAEPTVAAGEDRCAADPGFFGPYAASDPEEDFAESFSAFVFRVPANGPGQQARLDAMASRPELAEYRDRADAAGLTPRPNSFERCG